MLRSSRLLIGIIAGAATVLVTRRALVLLTYPHSVVTFTFATLWHWPLALLCGVVVLLVVCRSQRANRRSTWIFAAGAFLVGAVGLGLIRDLDMMNHFIAGFWVK